MFKGEYSDVEPGKAKTEILDGRSSQAGGGDRVGLEGLEGRMVVSTEAAPARGVGRGGAFAEAPASFGAAAPPLLSRLRSGVSKEEAYWAAANIICAFSLGGIGTLTFASVAAEIVFAYFMFQEADDTFDYFHELTYSDAPEEPVEVSYAILSVFLALADLFANITCVDPRGEALFAFRKVLAEKFPSLKETAFFTNFIQTPEERVEKAGATKKQLKLMSRKHILDSIIKGQLGDPDQVVEDFKASLVDDSGTILKNQERYKAIKQSANVNTAEEEAAQDEAVSGEGDPRGSWDEQFAPPPVEQQASSDLLAQLQSRVSPLHDADSDGVLDVEKGKMPPPAKKSEATQAPAPKPVNGFSYWAIYTFLAFPSLLSFPIGPLASVSAANGFAEDTLPGLLEGLHERFSGISPLDEDYDFAKDPAAFWWTFAAAVGTGTVYYIMLSLYDVLDPSSGLAKALLNGDAQKFWDSLNELKLGKRIFVNFVYQFLTNTVLRSLAFWFLGAAFIEFTDSPSWAKTLFGLVSLMSGIWSTAVTRGYKAFEHLFFLNADVSLQQLVQDQNRFYEANLNNPAFGFSFKKDPAGSDAMRYTVGGLFGGATVWTLARTAYLVFTSIRPNDPTNAKTAFAIAAFLSLIFAVPAAQFGFEIQGEGPRRERETKDYRMLFNNPSMQAFLSDEGDRRHDGQTLNTAPFHDLIEKPVVVDYVNSMRALSRTVQGYLTWLYTTHPEGQQAATRALLSAYNEANAAGGAVNWPGVQLLQKGQTERAQNLYAVPYRDQKMFDAELRRNISALKALKAAHSEEAQQPLAEVLRRYGPDLFMDAVDNSGGERLSLGAKDAITAFAIIACFTGQFARLFVTYVFASSLLPSDCGENPQGPFCEGWGEFDSIMLVTFFGVAVLINSFIYMKQKVVGGTLGVTNPADHSSADVPSNAYEQEQVRAVLMQNKGDTGTFATAPKNPVEVDESASEVVDDDKANCCASSPCGFFGARTQGSWQRVPANDQVRVAQGLFNLDDEQSRASAAGSVSSFN